MDFEIVIRALDSAQLVPDQDTDVAKLTVEVTAKHLEALDELERVDSKENNFEQGVMPRLVQRASL